MKKFVILFFAVTIFVAAQESKKLKEDAKVSGPVTLLRDKEKKEAKEGELKQYFLVLLKKGPVRNQDSASAAELQKGHLANITRLYNEGKIDLAGPIGSDGDLRGIFVFNCETYEEVMMHCSTDPAVRAGRLIAEIYPWWSAKGAKLR